MEKIKAYIGFAKASRKAAFGQNTIEKTKNIAGIICSSDLSEKSVKNLKTKTKNLHIIDKKIYDKLELNTLAVAITDKTMMGAIQYELEKLGEK